MQHASHSTIQLAGIVLKLRDDLTFSVREYGGEQVYVIEDELKSRFYRVGLSEYTFLSLLDGRRTFADALGQTASVMKDSALNESEAASLCRWLVETGLASTPESQSPVRLFEASTKVEQAKLKSSVNPMFVKIPLFNPDSMMKAGAAVAGWIFSAPAILMWLFVIAAGILCVGMKWDDATSMTSQIVSRNNWVWLIGITVALKLLHEFGHGIACRRFGGTVREAGVMTILFVPLPYVDVTSSWRLESRWQRLLISAAGMYIELFIAAIASIVWFNTSPGLLHQHAFTVMFSASLITVLFNANPLMRFDGYFMLTDVLEQPNLAGHGQMLLKSCGRSLFLGMPASPATWPEGRTWLAFVYGVAAFAWRITICLGLILGADAMFFGSGVILAAVAVVLWLVLPLFRLLRFVVSGSETEQPNRKRVAMMTTFGVVAAVLISNLSWSERFEAPAIVDYDPLIEIRSGVDGFVEEVAVSNGHNVELGQLLVQLRNPELLLQRSLLADELTQTRQRGRIYHQREEIAAWQVEIENAQAMEDRLQQLDDRIARLEIRAPAAGVIIDNSLQSIVGTYVNAGTLVVSLGANGSKNIVAMVSENDLHVFQTLSNERVDVHIDGCGAQYLTGILQEIDPRGSTRVPHPAFASTAGGLLDVRIAQPSHDAESDESRVVFAQPQFKTRVALNTESMESLHAGRTGRVMFRSSRGTIAEVAAASVGDWWGKRQAALQQTWTRR